MQNTVVISIGSNIEPQRNIDRAVQMLSAELQEIKLSHFVMTKPIGYEQQPDFVNGSACIETELSCEELRDKLKKIESALGRTPGANKNGPRTIDLDIVIWNGRIVHDDFYKREFLRQSVRELLPQFSG